MESVESIFFFPLSLSLSLSYSLSYSLTRVSAQTTDARRARDQNWMCVPHKIDNLFFFILFFSLSYQTAASFAPWLTAGTRNGKERHLGTQSVVAQAQNKQGFKLKAP